MQLEHPVLSWTVWILSALLIGLSSCAQNQLSVQELARYQKILDQGHPAMSFKDPALAAGLNLVGGFGYFYLEEWGHGFIALLSFPISWIWGIPAGYMDARRMNVRYTLEYYRRLEVEDTR